MSTSMTRRVLAAACTAYEPRTCTSCGGTKGQLVTEIDSDGVFRQHWEPCSGCGGSGVR